MPGRVASREDGRKRNYPNTVVFHVSNNNVATRANRNSRRVDTHGRTYAAGKGAVAAAHKCRYNAKRCNETNAVVIPISHNNNLSKGNYGHSPRTIEARVCARAIHKRAIAAARERGDDATRVGNEPNPVVAAVGHNNYSA